MTGTVIKNHILSVSLVIDIIHTLIGLGQDLVMTNTGGYSPNRHVGGCLLISCPVPLSRAHRRCVRLYVCR